MKHRVHLSFRMLAVVVAVVLAFGMIGVVFAASSVNVARVDNFASGADSLILTVPNDTAQTLTGTSYATVTQALGAYRTVDLTGVFAANRNGARVRYSVNTGGKTLGVSSDTGGTPYAVIKWDNTNNPLVLSPSGLGGVDLISGTNTGFVIEFQQIDVTGGKLGVRVYSSTNSSVYTVTMPSIIPSGSHVDYFIPFDAFTPELGSGVFFTSVGAIAWNLVGADSIDFEVTNYEADNVKDFGDLPNGYGTLQANNGPRHTVRFLRLGNNVDSEVDGQPVGTDALGDDTDGNAPYLPGDEDGITRSPLPVKWTTQGRVRYVVNGCDDNGGLEPCFLSGWIDFNADGDFNDAGENIIASLEVNNTAGTNTTSFSTAGADFSKPIYARFRLCGGTGFTDDCNTPTGASNNGEVEDYQWNFGPLAVTLNSLQAQPVTTSPVLPLALVGGAAIILIGAVLFTRKSRKQSV